MTNLDQSAEPEAKNTTLAIENAMDTAQSVPTESAHEHMRTIGGLLYDLIQDWQQQREDAPRGQCGHSEQVLPDESEGRQT